MMNFDVSPSFVNRNKATSSRLRSGGIHIGIVTRVEGTQLYVRVPKFGGTAEYGPCLFSGINPSINDKVLVAFLDNQLSELVCLGTLSKLGASYIDVQNQLLVIDDQLALKAPINNPTFTGVASGFFAQQNQIKTVTATSYDIITSDESQILEVDNGASAAILYLYSPSLTSMSVGSQFHAIRLGAGTARISADASTQINGTYGASIYLRAQFSMVTLIKRSTSSWYCIGDFST